MGGGPPLAQLVKHWAPAHGNEDGHYYICIGTGEAAGTNQPWLMALGFHHESSWSHGCLLAQAGLAVAAP
jgi:hypothetical protein